MREPDLLEDPKSPDNYEPLEQALISPIDGRRIIVRYEYRAVPDPSEIISSGVISAGSALVMLFIGVGGLAITLRWLVQQPSAFTLLAAALSSVPLLMAFFWSKGFQDARRGIRNVKGKHTIAGLVVARAQREFYESGGESSESYIATVRYLAVDDLSSDVITAWQVPRATYHEMALGKRVYVDVTADGRYAYAFRFAR